MNSKIRKIVNQLRKPIAMKKLVLILATLGLFFSCNPENNPSNNSDDAAKGLSAIDLGLSVKWGSCNLGASKPGGIW